MKNNIKSTYIFLLIINMYKNTKLNNYIKLI